MTLYQNSTTIPEDVTDFINTLFHLGYEVDFVYDFSEGELHIDGADEDAVLSVLKDYGYNLSTEPEV